MVSSIYKYFLVVCWVDWFDHSVDIFLHWLVGVEPWTFIQKLGDAVFIPAGLPHQVRNLKVKFAYMLQVSVCHEEYKVYKFFLGARNNRLN
jgi:hypothetical protein